MGDKSGIEWTDATWTPLRARVKSDAREIAEVKGYTSLLPIIHPGRVGPHCEHVSPGCEHCYSETNNGRCLTFNGTGLPFDRRARDLVDPFIDEKILAQPFHWKQPRKIFVCSQTDVFGDWYTDEQIYRVFMEIWRAHWHTYQVLTKRAERMFRLVSAWLDVDRILMKAFAPDALPGGSGIQRTPEPLANVWFGVSVEDQATADERIPLLLQTPAAVRFVSYEPALEAVRFNEDWLHLGCRPTMDLPPTAGKLDWIIVGGESGPGARRFDIEWGLNIVEQCAAAGVACFVKQTGSNPYWRGYPEGRAFLGDRKGGDIEQWPTSLRVRNFPQPASAEAGR